MAAEVETFLKEDLAMSGYTCYWSAGRFFRADNWRQVRTNIFGEFVEFFPVCIGMQGRRCQLKGVSICTVNLALRQDC